MFQIAEHLHKTVQEIQTGMRTDEFLGWVEYLRIKNERAGNQ